MYTVYLHTWQRTPKPDHDLLVQASSKDGNDAWQPWPIGMSWQYTQNSTKGESLQLGSHELLCFLGINPDTDKRRRPCGSGMNRKKSIETLSKNGFQNTIVDPSSYYAMLPSYKFVASPEGNGIDCHRHYEALLAGCIPILEKNPLAEEKYKGCPILWTTDYSEITPEYLEKVYTEMLEKTYDFSCLFLSNYSPEQQAEIKRCGNYWVQRTTQTTWYNDEKKL